MIARGEHTCQNKSIGGFMLSGRIAIDLGTAYSVVAHEKTEHFLRVASSVAYDRISQKAVAFGDEAKRMWGKCPERYEVILPLRDGVIADFAATQAYVDHLLSEACRSRFALNFEIYLCLPWGATPVEWRAYRQGFGSTRRRIHLVREPFAAALGCGLDVLGSEPVTIVDMGGGTTEIASIAEGLMLEASSLRAGGLSCDHLIQEGFRKMHGFELGLSAAEQIKIQHGSVWKLAEDRFFEVSGSARERRLPEERKISTEDLRSYLEPHALRVEKHIQQHIEKLPGSALRSLRENGILLCGGTSLLQGWEERLRQRLGVEVRRTANPLYAVIRGMKHLIQHRKDLMPLLKISEACLQH